jgi:hypothetical protein
MARKLFDIVYGVIRCMDCNSIIGSTDGDDSSDLCGSCAARRDSNGGDS